MLLPALLLALCGNAAFGEALDPSAYTLEEQDKVTDAAGVSSWLAVFHLHMPDLRIPLMPEDNTVGTGKAIDRDTLHAEWLVPEELLWISWMTTPCAGDGAYMFSAHVIVDVLATCNKEICRQSLPADTTRRQEPHDRRGPLSAKARGKGALVINGTWSTISPMTVSRRHAFGGNVGTAAFAPGPLGRGGPVRIPAWRNISLKGHVVLDQYRPAFEWTRPSTDKKVNLRN